MDILKPRKRLGRLRRVKSLGIIVPIKGGVSAGKGKGEVKESKE